MKLDFIIPLLKPLAEILVKILHFIDPTTRNMIRMRRAIKWGSKYIVTNEEIMLLENSGTLKTNNEKRIAYLKKKRKYYRRWFFDNVG